MKEFTYLEDRGGRIHVWNGIPFGEDNKDYYQRAVCGDPGDFMEYRDKKRRKVTCSGCRKKLGMPTQAPLFKEGR